MKKVSRKEDFSEKDIGMLRLLADGRVAVREAWLYDWLIGYQDQAELVVQDGDARQESLLDSAVL